MFGGLTLETIRLGFKNIALHKLRSFLTALGIICGVGAVICMLSITEGASEAELALIRLLGTYNIIVQSVKPEAGGEVGEAQSHLLDYGLTHKDLELIRATIPNIVRIVPLKIVANEVQSGAIKQETDVVGAEPAFFHTINVGISEGRPLNSVDQEQQAHQVNDDSGVQGHLRGTTFRFEGSNWEGNTPLPGRPPES